MMAFVSFTGDLPWDQSKHPDLKQLEDSDLATSDTHFLFSMIKQDGGYEQASISINRYTLGIHLFW